MIVTFLCVALLLDAVERSLSSKTRAGSELLDDDGICIATMYYGLVICDALGVDLSSPTFAALSSCEEGWRG